MPCVLTVKDGLNDWCAEHKRYHHGHQRKWALGTDRASVQKRELWDRLALGIEINPEPGSAKPIPYTAAQVLANYAETLARHIAGGRVMVPDDVRADRRSKCDACEHRNKERDSCKICKCSLSPSELQATIIGDKLRWAVAECPVGKWGEWHENDLRNLPGTVPS